ncbi:MAG TPA: glycosyltransferase family 39 protein [Stenomitos sp.]
MTSLKVNSRLDWGDGILLGAALILLTFGIGQYGLFEPHEGHFAGVAREMVLRGDWVTPTLNGAPYLNKPPLLYWLIALSYRIFGISEFAARLPVAVSAWVGVVIAWAWSRQVWGTIAARATVVLLSTSVGWFIFAHQILIDELLGTLLLALMYCLWQLLRQPQSRTIWVLTYVILGLAILAKGVLAIAFWVVACGAVVFTRRQWKTVWIFRPFLGLAIAFAVVLPWLIAVEHANPGFLQYFLLNENVKRALDTRWPPDYSISKISAWGYLLVSALWCLPWMLLLPPALKDRWQEWRQGRSALASVQQRQTTDALTVLGVLAVLPIVLFLPLSSRLYYYSVPAIPPLAMMVGCWWSTAGHGQSEVSRKSVGWIMTALGVAIATGLLWLPQQVIGFFPELAQTEGVQTIVTVQLVGLGVGFIGSGTFLLRKQLVIALVLLWFGFGTTWTAMVQGFKTIQDFRSSRTLILEAKQSLPANTQWIFEGSRELGAAGAMSFYLDASQQLKSNHATAVPTAKGTYETVYVLTDGGPNRLPPSFPGPKPKMLITKAQMQAMWQSPQPVVFITDFLRRPNDPNDPPTLNLPRDAGTPLLQIGPRTLYGNAIAHRLWQASPRP